MSAARQPTISKAPPESSPTQTIDDFSDQWNIFPENEGYFASVKLFTDSLAGLIDESEIKDKVVADIGSGTGRIVGWLGKLGAKQIYAIEPATSLEVLKANTKEFADKIVYRNTPGAEIGLNSEIDLVVSLGVISYIPDLPALFKAVHTSLRPGGKFFVLAMAKEGNELYCTFVVPLRKLSVHLPNSFLFAMCSILAIPASIYSALCKALSFLPMRNYFANVYSKMNWHHRVMLIFDQLNPTYVRFLTRRDLEQLFSDAGFTDIKLVHRYGYSWAASAKR